MSSGSHGRADQPGGPLRLLHVLYSGKGGLGTYFLELVESDRNERFSHSAIFYGIEALDPEYERFARDRGIPFTVIRKRRGPDLVSTIRLVAAMKQPADAIVLHSGAGAGAMGALLRTATSRCPLIQVEHTTSEVKTRRDRFWTSLSRVAADRTVIFYPEHREELGMGTSRCVLIPKRPDTSFFHPAPRPEDGELRIGMQGRLSVHKDHPTLFRAFAIASAKSSLALSLHIAGDGHERERLAALSNDLGIASKVHFHGMLDRSQLRAMLQNLDVYVHATHGETACFAIMEAQACGLPVVGSDVQGVRDAVEEGVTGLLYVHRDSEALASRLLQLIEAPEQRASLGKAARARMLEEASRQPTAEAYYEMLLGILAAQRSPT
jgi:glycosyltransferase involved in cell wall biosynthesis